MYSQDCEYINKVKKYVKKIFMKAFRQVSRIFFADFRDFRILKFLERSFKWAQSYKNGELLEKFLTNPRNS